MSAGLSFGGGKGESEQKSSAGKKLEKLMTGFATETAPVRQELLRQFMSILTTGGVGAGESAPAPAPASAPATRRVPIFETRKVRNKQRPVNWDEAKGPYQAYLTRRVLTGYKDAPIDGAGAGVTPATGGSTGMVPIVNRALEASLRAGSQATEQTEEDLARSELLDTPFGQEILAGTKREGALTASQVPTNIAMQLINMIPNFLLGQGQTIASGLGAAVPGNVTNKGERIGMAGSGGYEF